MVRKSIIFWLSFSLLLGTVAILAIYRAWPLLFPKITETAPLDPQCDLRVSACTSFFPSGAQVRFQIRPKTIPVLKPLALEVQLESILPQGIEVDFSGTDMNMGYNRATLERKENNRWVGQAVLPACVRDHMQWEATVLLRTEEKILAAPFRFSTYQN